jgi:hypothetical protein
MQSCLQTVLLQNNKLTKYPSVLFHIPSLKVVQIDGNPIGQSENESEAERPEMTENGKSSEEGSDSGIASQEEEMSEKNKSESEKSETKCPTLDLSLKNEDGLKRNVRFFTDVILIIIRCCYQTLKPLFSPNQPPIHSSFNLTSCALVFENSAK